MTVKVKLRVLDRNPAHTRVGVYTAVDGEGDRPGRPWHHNGVLIFDTDEWAQALSLRFEAMGVEVEQ